jgi:hypothetical protein
MKFENVLNKIAESKGLKDRVSFLKDKKKKTDLKKLAESIDSKIEKKQKHEIVDSINKNDYVSMKKGAKLIGISTSQLGALLFNGSIPGVKVKSEMNTKQGKWMIHNNTIKKISAAKKDLKSKSTPRDFYKNVFKS